MGVRTALSAALEHSQWVATAAAAGKDNQHMLLWLGKCCQTTASALRTFSSLAVRSVVAAVPAVPAARTEALMFVENQQQQQAGCQVWQFYPSGMLCFSSDPEP
jgi:hypothetical protein